MTHTHHPAPDINRLSSPEPLDHEQILAWLHEERDDRLKALWDAADRVRRDNVGDDVHLRGLIEISNHCVRRCGYCGLNARNRDLERYRMTVEEILACVDQAVRFGYGTVVLQAGEDEGITTGWLADIVGKVKSETKLAVTLSLGERDDDALQAWRQAGADRYLLRFETSDQALYEQIHPSRLGRPSDRIAQLTRLRDFGYEIGSGVMIGIPGQSYASLARDIELFRSLDLDMIGVGPYISHPATALADQPPAAPLEPHDQVPNSEDMTYKVVALTRLVCPEANIPSTTALATLNKATGRELGLSRGANVVMPNLTPPKYRVLYEIYPAKACLFETADDCRMCLKHRIESLGRFVARGPGSRRSG